MEDPFPNSNPNPDFTWLSSFDEDIFTGDFNFPGAGDEIPLDIDFDIAVEDFSFADDLLLDPLDEPGPDPPGSVISQARAPVSEEDQSPNVVRVYDQEPNSSRDSNCKSNSGGLRDSGNNGDRDVSSSFLVNNSSCEIGDFDWKNSKVEDKLVKNYTKCIISKRKKEQQEQLREDRTRKLRKSSSSLLASESANFNAGSDDDNDDKRKARLIRNRESAQLSRERKKQHVEELENKVRSMHSTITELNSKIMYIMSENASLRQQLSGGAPPMPPPGMYNMPQVAYPWIPYPPYMLKPQGSQVPLVPIPRLTPLPQSPKPARKSSKKSGGKTKKVASVSLLGLLFFFLLFGGLVPMVNVRFGGNGNGLSELQKGMVLMVDKHVERIGYGGGTGVSDGKLNHHGRTTLQQSNVHCSDGIGPMGNSSEPLVASLYVPRNDKMVKIDGNLIIHSVLASEKAMASHAAKGVKIAEETSLAIPGHYEAYPISEPGRSTVRHPHLDGKQRALGYGSPELKPAGSDGKLQQWFREGHAGPMLSSGMCTEVFQFDISPLPGAMVPAIANSLSKHLQNSTHPNKPRNRRILRGKPTPFDTNKLNATKDHRQPHEPSNGLQSNNSRSSMVVSVLVDPREASNGNGESVIRSKASRIFVVVLVDSVKYVTYSCILPFVGSGTHLVTA